jgi:hypothetical protein
MYAFPQHDVQFKFEKGLTLRQYYAGKILQGHLITPQDIRCRTNEYLKEQCRQMWRLADLLIETEPY